MGQKIYMLESLKYSCPLHALNSIIPNVVGKPKTNPSASARSLEVIRGASLFGGALILKITSSWIVSGTTCQEKNASLDASV